jgi:signal transduction histidine kinase
MNQTGDAYVLVHAPFGRDALLICRFLGEAGISTEVCTTVEDLCSAVQESAGAALISDQSLTRENISALAAALHNQPQWSDFPLIITITESEQPEESQRLLEVLGPVANVSLLERPLRSQTLVSAAHAALRARRRQYQLRDFYIERDRLVMELTRSNEDLAQFSYVASHDLQAPIRTLRIFSQLLARDYKGQLDSRADGFIGTIESAADTMEKLVRTLLDYATVGHGQISRRKVALGGVVDAVMTSLHPTIERLGAEVDYTDLPSVDSEPVLLQQLLQNLIGNALKYCDPTVAPRIRISAEEASDKWTVSVTDNGTGIAPQYQASIFQPLQRLHGKEIPGTGLGLAICKKIVARHGGEIWVESEIGKGATFLFTLPKSAADLSVSTSSLERKSPASGTNTSISARA